MRRLKIKALAFAALFVPPGAGFASGEAPAQPEPVPKKSWSMPALLWPVGWVIGEFMRSPVPPPPGNLTPGLRGDSRPASGGAGAPAPASPEKIDSYWSAK